MGRSEVIKLPLWRTKFVEELEAAVGVGDFGGVGGGCKPIAKFMSAPRVCVCAWSIFLLL